MLLLDQPAEVEWFPMVMRAVGLGQPNYPTRRRMKFETGDAAVEYVTTTLPEACRANATIQLEGGVRFCWDDIEAMNKPRPTS